jgi:hypothetical protein
MLRQAMASVALQVNCTQQQSDKESLPISHCISGEGSDG